MGALLVTDGKPNLHEMFEPGREVAAYNSPAECLELVRHFLDNEDERARMSRAGQERTLRDHTYATRMRELVDIVSAHT
jgi:spore maturation protein CgeB